MDRLPYESALAVLVHSLGAVLRITPTVIDSRVISLSVIWFSNEQECWSMDASHGVHTVMKLSATAIRV